MAATTTIPPVEPQSRATPEIDADECTAIVRRMLGRRPAVGLALGIVRDGRLAFFHGHGLADVATSAPITERTVFRIGSITKTVTAIAVMQLWELGLIDLDAPASEYLRAYRLVPADRSWRPVTVRHLLTHTAGIPEVVRVSDLLHPGWGPFAMRPAVHSARIGDRLPSLADYYRGALRVVAEPGTVFAYTGHGFATLGQIVEDVSGEPLDRYVRDHVLEPLGMAETDLDRTERVRSRMATGYDLGPGGAKAVVDRDWIGRAGGGLFSSTRDMARYVAALLGAGANEHGSVLRPATLAMMFEPQFQPDARQPGMGLGFFRGDVGGHRVVEHDGLLPGFVSVLVVAPDDGLGVVAFTNGSKGAFTWLPIEVDRLLRHLLQVPHEAGRGTVPHHPEVWPELCGWYRLPPRVSDLRGRIAMGGGAQVFVRDGRLMVRLLTPVPALYRGLPLDPDDARDPYAFRLDLSPFGMPVVRVVFRREAGRGVTAAHTDLQLLSLYRRPEADGPGARVIGTFGALGASALALGAAAVRRRRGHSGGTGI